MAAGTDRVFTVRMLGELQVHRVSDGEPVPLGEGTGPRAVFLRLMLANGEFVHIERLQRTLQTTSASGDLRGLARKYVSQVRNALDAEPEVLETKGQGGTLGYRLAPEAFGVDARDFTEGVKRLPRPPAAPDPGEVDRLLRMWTGDPREQYRRLLDQGLWGELYRSRDRLAEAAARLAAGGGEVEAWPGFRSCFELDPGFLRSGAARRLDEGRAAPQRAAESRRILLVEDRFHDWYRERLAGYDCVVVRSLAEWHALKAGEPGLDFDLALVDRHLTEESDDSDGLGILEEMLDMGCTFPRVLMTVEIPEEYDSEEIKRRYGVSTIVQKDRNRQRPEGLNLLRQVVRRYTAR
ncbi:hypothetical protein J0910_13515 [Nocardiopsis sp. CNT-189]|uniref:hypothetical protein n=1 Tax=Nocardiopsis oceanisediminis TaxID=2816862 RepID=UPI003B2CD5E5